MKYQRAVKDQETLEKLFQHSPLLKQAYQFKNELTQILDSDVDRRCGKQRITGWMNRVKKSSVHCFDTFLKTLEAYKNEVANYFLDRLTSGFVEGLNNKIKVIKRRCYGLKNIEHPSLFGPLWIFFVCLPEIIELSKFALTLLGHKK